MEDKTTTRKYKNDDFRINCIYNEKGEPLYKVIENAFKSYYEYKVRN